MLTKIKLNSLSKEIKETVQFTYSVITTNSRTLSSNQGYYFNTSNGPLTAILPPSPNIGSYVDIVLEKNNNNLTLLRNNSKINGVNDNLLCDISAKFSLIYISNETGWKLI